MLLFTWVISWSLVTPSMLARELKLSCALYWFILEYKLIFSKTKLHLTQQLSFLGMCWVTVDMSISMPSYFGSTGGGSLGILMYQSMSMLLHLGKSPISGNLEVEHFQLPLDISGQLCVSSSSFSSPGSVQVPVRTWQRSMYSSDTFWDGVSLASHNSQCVGRHSPFM